jgi:preprotein translocase subunit SecD
LGHLHNQQEQQAQLQVIWALVVLAVLPLLATQVATALQVVAVVVAKVLTLAVLVA